MPRTFARTVIAPGITREGDRLIARVRVGSSRDGLQAAPRHAFPLGTALVTMQAWQLDQKRKLLLDRPAAIERGSLAADIAGHLATLPEGRYRIDTRILLGHWARSPLGAKPRQAITRAEVRAQISQWRNAGAAAATCNRRLSSLRACLGALDPDAPNATDAVKYQRPRKIEPRDIPVRIVKLILDSLPDQGRAERFAARPTVSHTKIRLRVMAWTGMAPATIARVAARDLELDRPAGARIYLNPREKGAGRDGAWMKLLTPAVDALRDFRAAKLVGKRWSNSSAGKTWRVGIARATETAARIAAETGDDSWARELDALPPRCKPYDLRHSFGSEIYRATGDIRAVSELLQHSELETTKRYTKGAVSERVTAAIDTATAVYANVPTPPVAKPAPKLRIVHAAR
jgi:integrase/recombinase XerC